jgi:hypothetical protein
VQWCRDNDDKCREIAARARELYETYCAKDGILDYLELVTHKIAERHRYIPAWWAPAPLVCARVCAFPLCVEWVPVHVTVGAKTHAKPVKV